MRDPEVTVALATVVEAAIERVDRGASDELAARQILGYVQRHWADLRHLGVRSVRDLTALRVTVQGGGDGASLSLRRECSACGGEGRVAASDDARPEELRGIGSMACRYCREGRVTVERRVTLDLRDVPALRSSP